MRVIPFVALFFLVPARFLVAADDSGAAAERVFFAFDDHAIPLLDNLQLNLVAAEKYAGNPVVRRGPEGSVDYGQVGLYGTVIRDGGKFRMWYMASPERLKPGERQKYWRPMCYAESEDGIHWDKPELGLVEFNGNRRNNICLIESEDVELTKVDDFLSVLYEPQDPDPARRYKMAYIAHYPVENIKGGIRDVGSKERLLCAMVCAVSADGVRWKVLGDRPCVNEKFEVSGLYHFGNFYYVTGQQISPWVWLPQGEKVGRTTVCYRSPDLVHWSTAKGIAFVRAGQTIAPPITGEQTHMGAGMWNRGNVMVGLYGMWQDGPVSLPKGVRWPHGVRVDLGLIVSDDGLHFREPVPDFKIVSHGNEGEWDSKSLLQGHAFANVGDKTYIWYSHWDTDQSGLAIEIGLATLRRDGFGYLACHNPQAPGHAITTLIPADSQGRRLAVNVEGVSTEKPLTLELLDEFDRPLPGYSGADAAKVTEAGTRRAVTWPAHADGLCPQDNPFAVRVNFPASSEARLYAVYVQPAPPSPIKILRMPGGLRFGLIGQRSDHPLPTLFVLGHGLETMQKEPVYTEVARILAAHGVLSVIIDPPAHGEDVRPGEPANAMEGWRLRLEKGEDFVGAFTTNAKSTLDYLIKEGYSDPDRIAACGISRGGFLAFHFAAVDPRVKAAAGISPLTDLMALREFTGTSHRKEAARFSIISLAPKLAGRAVWVSIGNDDQRVDTDLAIAFTRAVVRAGAAQTPKHDPMIPVDLIVGPTAGHQKIDRAHELLADWILKQFGMAQNAGH